MQNELSRQRLNLVHTIQSTVNMIKKQTTKSTDKSAFFKLLNLAARPKSKRVAKTSARNSDGGYSDSKTRSNISGNASVKRGEKSRERNV